MPDYIEKLRDAIRRGHRFATHDVWQIGEPGEELPQGFVIKQVRVAILLGSKLVDGAHMVRASALTFATLLSIVPFLALMFYVIQTFNLDRDVYTYIQNSIESAAETVSDTFGGDEPEVGSPDVAETEPGTAPSQPPAEEVIAEAPIDSGDETGEADIPAAATQDDAPGAEDAATAEEGGEEDNELQRRIIEAIFQGVTADREGMEDPVQTISDAADTVAALAKDAAGNTAALTISGIVLVLTTVFGLMRNIENTFNRIWGVRRKRSWYRMITDYMVITLLMPFVVTAVLGVMAALQSETFLDVLGPFSFALRFSQLVLVGMLFSALYRFVPNTRVDFRYAFLGGFVAAALWVLLTWGYINFQFGLARYAVILSAFAQFPMLLMWVYLSWAIVLLGCEVTYAYQNERTFALERFAEDASTAYRESIGFRAMLDIGHRFQEGLPELTVEQAAREWNVPMRLLSDVLDGLVEARLVAPRASDPTQYQPARPLDRITAADIIRALREQGTEPSRFREDDRLHRIFDELDRRDDAFGGATLEELIVGYAEALAAGPEPSEQQVHA